MVVDGKQFTSNSTKLLQHLDKLQGLKDGVQSPVMIHLAPTNICNLECEYCCYAGRDTGESLSKEQVKRVISDFSDIGVRGLEWTGGGDPSLWKNLDEMIEYAHQHKLSQGLITNGIKNDWQQNYNRLQWTRVSMHGFNEGKEDKIRATVEKMRRLAPEMTISGTYIWTHGSENVFPKVAKFVEDYKIPTRVTPDLTLGKQSIDFMMKHVGDNVKENGSGYTFLSDFNVDTNRSHNRCYMSAVKPFIFPDGWVYDCPSIGLTPDTKKNVGSPYRVCRIEDIAEHYSKPFPTGRTNDCGFCKYQPQNDLVDAIMAEVKHKDFA